jgi:hypothetical protein
MRDWAARAGVSWALDPAVKMPSEEKLKAMPIEDVGTNFVGGKDGSKGITLTPMKFPYRIRTINMKPSSPKLELVPLPVDRK